jgi:ring-1,2-phenylacetyl-CoA epoxidase subunit PaaE
MDTLTFRIKKIKLETLESYTFYLQEVNGKTISYRAGQFLTLLLNINGREVRRSYSLSSTPGIDKELSFTVKRVMNGEVSRYLTDNLKEGDLLQTLLPAGRFTINYYNEELFVFVAAGSGITPVFALIKDLLSHPIQGKILLIYQNRNEETSIFRKELLLLQEGYRGKFSIMEIFSQPINHELPARRLNNTLFEQVVKQNVSTSSIQFYVCGPALFMHMIEFTLKMLGYNNSVINKENFTINTPPPPAFMIDPDPRKVTVHHKHHQYEFEVKFPQNILQAALQHNVHLPYSCRGGRCSTCTVRLLSGKIKMTINDILTEEDLAEGLALTCVGYAETDVVIQL